MNVGTLTLEMAANVARLQKDMDAARRTVDGAMKNITASASLAMKALGAIGVGLSVSAFKSWIQGAIDAADQANKLSQKIGVAVKDLAGMQLAFAQGGVSAEGLQKAMSKLSVGIMDHNKALEAMGIVYRNQDGSLKSSREVLGEVADKFASYEDGVAKTKLAVELFGKAGADMIPVLNAGGQSLDAYDAIAQRLGLTLSKETAEGAEKFNDTMELIKEGSHGTATAIAADLLPTLQNLSAMFLEYMHQGEGVHVISGMIDSAIKGIATAAVYSYYALKDLGSVLQTIYDQGKALASMDFSGVATSQAKRDAEALQNAADLAAAHDRIWKIAGDAGVDAMAKIVNASRRAAPEIGALADAQAAAAKKAADEYARMIKSADDLVASIQFDTKVLTMNNVEKETAIALQKLATFGIKEGTAEYRKYSEAVIAATLDKEQVQSIVDSNKRIEEARLAEIKKAEEERVRLEKNAQKEITDIGNQIGQSLSDAIMNGGKSASQYLKDLFRTLILRPIVQPLIAGVVGSIMTGAAGSALAGDTVSALGSSSGSALGIAGAAAKLKSLYDMATGSFASLGETVSNFTANLGAQIMGLGDASAEAGMAIMDSAGTIGTAASYLGGIGAGLGLGNLISGGKSVGGNSWITSGAGTAIGLAVAGPIGAAVGGALGGVINAAFGMGAKESTGSGIKGSFSSAGAAAMSYQSWDQKGGWFRSGDSGADYTALPTDLHASLNAQLAGIAGSVGKFIKSLGQVTGAVSAFSQEIDISLTGLTADEANAKIAGAIAGFGDALTTYLLPEIANFQKAGETSSATLNRLGTSLLTVNSVFNTLKLGLKEASLSSASAASALIDLFGGLDKFVSATDYYYQNFYSEQERAAKTTEQLRDVFKQLGLALPDSKAAFRDLVGAAQAAGNDALFASLIKLAPAFNDLQTSLANLSGTAATVTQTVDSAFSALQSSLSAAQDSAIAAIDAQRTVAQAQKDIASQSVSALESVFNYLGSQIADIRQIVDSSQSAAQSFAFLRDALTVAQQGGVLPSQDALASAVSAARAALIPGNYATSLDMKADQMRLVGQLQSLQAIAGDQKSTAERQLDTAQATLDALDAQATATKDYYAQQLALAQNQVNELRGIGSGVLSVADALATFGAVVNSARPSSTSASMSDQVNALYESILGRAADPQGLANWLASGLSIDGIRQGILGSDEAKLRGYASGGAYPGGLAMVGESGPELINFDRPGMVYTAAQTSSLLSAGAVVSELRSLRADSEAQARASVSLQARMNRLFERWDVDGIPSTRLETA